MGASQGAPFLCAGVFVVRKRRIGNPSEPALSDKERRFVEAYLDNGRSGAKAWRAVFGPSKHPRVDSQKAAHLLKTDRVAAALDAADARNEARTQALIERYALSEERILQELASLAFASSLDVMRIQEDGTAVIDLTGLDRREAAAIAEVTVDEYMEGRGPDARPVKRVRVKLADKLRALNMLGQRLGLWRRTLDVKCEDGAAKVDGGGLSALLEEAARLAAVAADKARHEQAETTAKALPGQGPDDGARRDPQS